MGLFSSLFGMSNLKQSEVKHTAAMNALVAKHIFNQMGGKQRQEVLAKIQTILSQVGGWPPDEAASLMEQMLDPTQPKTPAMGNMLNEKAFFGFAALAMEEIGIVPPKIWRWQVVKNPFVALADADKEIEIARIGLHKRGKIDVSFE